MAPISPTEAAHSGSMSTAAACAALRGRVLASLPGLLDAGRAGHDIEATIDRGLDVMVELDGAVTAPRAAQLTRVVRMLELSARWPGRVHIFGLES